MIKTYMVEYDYTYRIKVEINTEIAPKYMKEMLLFWGSGKERIRKANGDITEAFLKFLGYSIFHQSLVSNDAVAFLGKQEGWYPLDGSHGIKVLFYDDFELDESCITVEDIT